MCGIFAYIGDRQALELLITALKRLEYRGYDSAGIGIHGKPLQVRKKVGKVVNLEEECKKGGGVQGTIGIAHTRWATHGQPSDTNSHPHTTEDKTIAVVHNGVIENYRALKTELQQKGYNFASQTDTELLAHLVQDLRKQMPTATWAQVVSVALSLVQGAYGVVFLFEDSPDLLIGARKGSPLILGVGKGEYMLASDASAIVEHTQDVIYIQEDHIVEVNRSDYRIRTIEQTVASALGTGPGSPRSDLSADHPILRLEMSLEEIEKGGYPHFMLKEIMDQPNAVRNAMRGRLYRDVETSSMKMKLGGLEKEIEGQKSYIERMAAAKRIIICACGTSWHSGLIGKYALESLAEMPVEVEYASEFRYRKPLLSSEDVVIAISQSGETADTLEAIRIAQEFKALTIGIVNSVGSSIARATDAGLYLHAGPEIGVASTKAFTCQVAAIVMVALALAERRGAMSEAELQAYRNELEKVPDIIERWLNPQDKEQSIDQQMKMIAKYFRLAPNVLFCGSGVQFPVSLEGALKLKEISYIHAEGFPATEIMHGPLTLVRSFMPIIVVAMKSDPAYSTMKKRVNDFLEKDAGLIILTDEGNHDFDGLPCFLVFCPATKLEFEPLLTVVPLQLFSYYIAEMRGCSIDQPRNLAKSVTVE
mmetsp:Transcript_2462/g.5318  ORF Transcript_2462/g.5318 Transcript_2462/m.5318 type:complete len:649 (+) Transcript_2462:95-2041(+)